MFADAQLLTMFFFHCVETPRFLDISLSRLTDKTAPGMEKLETMIDAFVVTHDQFRR